MPPAAGPGGTDAGPRPDPGPVPPPPSVCTAPLALVDTTSPEHVVGDGTAASCTEAELRTAVSAGGTITFDCGAGPTTITLTAAPVPTRDTTLDGGGRM